MNNIEKENAGAAKQTTAADNILKQSSKIPKGPLSEKWSTYKANQKLVNPANKRR